MLASFTHPVTMATGAALVSTPIIIHLINRMRFRRVKWAAMEFLLKAQKRTRRKMILEQLILLLLRCLIVFLVGMLLARYIGFDQAIAEAKESQPVARIAHIIVLDDTPSMDDVKPGASLEQRKDPEQRPNALLEAKKWITDDILRAASRKPDPQTLDLIILSEASRPESFQNFQRKPENAAEGEGEGPITEKTVGAVHSRLNRLRPSTVRVPITRGLSAARDAVARRKEQVQKLAKDLNEQNSTLTVIVYVVADLRALDWTLEGADLPREFRSLSELSSEKDRVAVKLQLVDCAPPETRTLSQDRSKDTRRPIANGNLAITEFRPLTRVAALNQPVDFEIKVKNFGTAEVENLQVEFFRNGEANVEKTADIDKVIGNQVNKTIAPGEEVRKVVTLRFDERRPAPFNQPKFGRYSQVTASLLRTEDGGLQTDNSRHAVIEVQDALPVLLVGGRTGVGEERPEGDLFYIKAALRSAVSGNRLIEGTMADLDGTVTDKARQNLRQYAAIFLVNIPEFSKTAAERLGDYVRGGGGLAILLGPNVKPESYNTLLYNEGTGLFPAPLDMDRFQRLDQKMNDRLRPPEKGPTGITPPAPDEYPFRGVYARNPESTEHPILTKLYQAERRQGSAEVTVASFFPYVKSSRCWPIERTGRWMQDPTVKELLCLGNDGLTRDYGGEVARLARQLRNMVNEQARFADIRSRIKADTEAMEELVKETRTDDVPLSYLTAALDALLDDDRESGGGRDPALQKIWELAEKSPKDPEIVKLQTSLRELRDKTKYGPPMCLAKEYGAGRVILLTTFTGARMGPPRGGRIDAVEPRWTDWPDGAGGASWPVFVAQLYRHLAAAPGQDSWVVGDLARLPYKPGLYKLESDGTILVKRSFLRIDTELKKGQNLDLAPEPTELKVVKATPEGETLAVPLTDIPEPGLCIFELPRADETTEYLAYTVNLDAAREGNLERASDEELKQAAPGAEIRYRDRSAWGDGPKLKAQERKERPPEDLSTRTWLFALLLFILAAEQAMAVRVSYHTRPDDVEAHAPTAAAAYSRGHAPAPAEDADLAPHESSAAAS